jgi:hypothetical protein
MAQQKLVGVNAESVNPAGWSLVVVEWFIQTCLNKVVSIQKNIPVGLLVLGLNA